MIEIIVEVIVWLIRRLLVVVVVRKVAVGRSLRIRFNKVIVRCSGGGCRRRWRMRNGNSVVAVISSLVLLVGLTSSNDWNQNNDNDDGDYESDDDIDVGVARRRRPWQRSWSQSGGSISDGGRRSDKNRGKCG